MYNEPIKIKSRHLVIGEAIKNLTDKRNEVSLVSQDYLRIVREKLVSQGDTYANHLTDQGIQRWENFYKSLLGTKTAQDLKVAYLCGPNPENDLEVFVRLGVLPENIWAFELDHKNYESAVELLKDSKFQNVKVYDLNIEHFIKNTDIKFDIVYFDFCSPVISSKDNRQLACLTRFFEYHRLSSPGVVITNFSFPSVEQDAVTHNNLLKLSSTYLYPKQFLEFEKVDEEHDNMTEGASANGLQLEEFHERVKASPEFYYGQFITRLMMDLSLIIVPSQKFIAEKSYLSRFFNIRENQIREDLRKFISFTEDGDGGDLICEMSMHAVYWALVSCSEKFNPGEGISDWLNDPAFASAARRFCSQLSIEALQGNQQLNIEAVLKYAMLKERAFSREHHTHPSLIELSKSMGYGNFYQFCDVFLFNQALDLLLHQLSMPYHMNVAKTQRWRYKAKETEMFLDMLVFDECRYVYDWMPTLAMFRASLNNLDQQLAYRFALDGVSKHRHWYNPELFFGTASVGINYKGFEAKLLELRNLIEDESK